jgi:hypothetical protein
VFALSKLSKSSWLGVEEFMVRVLHCRRVLLGFTMLCDVIGAVTEFMVWVLHVLRSVIGIHAVARVEAGLCCDLRACLSSVHAGIVATIKHVRILNASFLLL